MICCEITDVRFEKGKKVKGAPFLNLKILTQHYKYLR